MRDLTPAELSTGMKQRLGLARVLAGQAELLLMDEARFAALDFSYPGRAAEPAFADQARMPRTIVLVTPPAGRAYFACTEDCGDALGQQPVGVQLGRQRLPPGCGRATDAGAEAAHHGGVPKIRACGKNQWFSTKSNSRCAHNVNAAAGEQITEPVYTGSVMI